MDNPQASCWSIGALVEFERESALREYSDQLPGTRTLDELLALHIIKIEQQLVHRSGGRMAIWTRVIGKRRGYDISRWEEYTTKLGGENLTSHYGRWFD